MRIDPETGTTSGKPKKDVKKLSRNAAIAVCFVIVYYFFIKLLFL